MTASPKALEELKNLEAPKELNASLIPSKSDFIYEIMIKKRKDAKNRIKELSSNRKLDYSGFAKKMVCTIFSKCFLRKYGLEEYN